MIKKILVLFLCCFLCAGCCRQKNNEVVLKFSTWGSASEMSILTKIVKDFELENKNVKIEIIHIPQDYFPKIHLLFASNLAPDVIFINNLNLPVYSKYLLDCTDLVNGKDFYTRAIKSFAIDGKIYAVPRDISNLVIYYNKALFKKYGIPYPNYDWTMDDFISVLKRFHSRNVWGISYVPKIYYGVPFVLNNNRELIGSKEDIYIDRNDIFSKGITLYKDFAYKYGYAPTPAQTGSYTQAQLFLNEKIAMHLSGRWLVPKYRNCAKFDWDVVNFPCYAVPCDSSGWAISKNSKNIFWAKKFVEYLSSSKNISRMAESGLIVPARENVSQSPSFLNGKPSSSKVFLDTVRKSIVLKHGKDFNVLNDNLDRKYFSD